MVLVELEGKGQPHGFPKCPQFSSIIMETCTLLKLYECLSGKGFGFTSALYSLMFFFLVIELARHSLHTFSQLSSRLHINYIYRHYSRKV